MRPLVLALALLALAHPVAAEDKPRSPFDALIASHAQANGVPELLVHRVIVQESRYNPRAVGRGGTFGLMQIKHATARGVGYTGPASGLLDPDTNLTYAVRYLAGAFRAANGNADRAVAYFRSGYYRPKHKGQRAVAQRGKPQDATASTGELRQDAAASDASRENGTKRP
jgi:soluble lytic murein transglycosylase-like protein